MRSKRDIAIITSATAAGNPSLNEQTRLIGRVPIAGIFFLLLLWQEAVLAGSPPAIQPSATFQHQSVALGSNMTFTASVTGDLPLFFQWRLAAADLIGCTNRTLAITNAQPSDEGDYTVLATNAYGAITSAPVRLYVVPPSANMVKGNYTNTSSVRLPYFYDLPAGYDPLRRYPLVILMHGTPGDETTAPPFFASYAATRVFASYGQQATDPVILVWPSRRPGDNSWTDPYLQLVSGLIDKLIADFSIDTNRVYIAGRVRGSACRLGSGGDAPLLLCRCGLRRRLVRGEVAKFNKRRANVGLVRPE